MDSRNVMVAKPLSLAISTFKGGAGKSTLNVNLAAEFAQQGHRTLLIDCDEQESSTRWYNVSMKRGLLPTDGTLLHCRIGPGDRFPDRLSEAPEADIRIYDVGGYVHHRAIEVYHECDAVLIPIIPEPTAATSAIKVATILTEISKKRAAGPIPFAAIWNYIDMIALKHNRSLPEVHTILTSGKIPIVDTVVRKSNHFSDVGAGFGSLYSKLATIESNQALTLSAKRRACESVLDAIDLVKRINNEFIGLLQREAA
ncbi:ParA family protein (plasmid) [Aliirhizobium terrae]|uniref:ParA family protein n=1 Tax=Terrirhizobium terrae TaxID=2926709 RepID=UPI00257699D1|nr:ParA family protein [Rhizobium sp. CC-CFT758]WJH38551.1 ParA family protein [Rhizobium sp. CC-CFT758]